ncbi:MAG: phenylalanine--tRNA ligase subunit beta [Dokdonella sp.]|mgnify:CR=1 FL=1|uniref:phenylalanine--tRNA ligase subunit beta n=1 Tax=Dokdonella sp. TaxID=2291710 RepID=UPI002BD37FDF|nr:phenylalanine--tRNA ligase subunit beta [Dokdonella sp.]HOX72286.1 phenylalanine--tRNA ligase subunit beta [Dokdonella sp.]HPG94700.1 phenylalanine--tRNA ligase subunit beta [Dokdonella sp.]HPN79707.1 phenylalanine--tRNA ligase subunit beta [Dokdonella sp.]
MKFSENWLRELVEIPVGRSDFAHRLTMSGLEVEGIDMLGAALDGIVVAEILAAEKHPDADKLKVCRVDIGTGETLQIVCGAPNARAGLKAPLAVVGTRVGEITIKAAKLRGVESNGMLCSGRELGLDNDFDGLLELPASAPVGESLAKFLLLPDALFEIGLTPNRSDCLGMHGLAREVAAEFGVPVRIAEVAAVPAVHQDTLAVRIEVPADCPRYCGRLLRGLDASAATPQWMAERLRRSGMRPVSILVDVTNYVMIEMGQPMHAFDAGSVTAPIVVRRARKGETLKLLDERTVELSEDFVVIADQAKAIALGGVMGGFDTRVTDSTTDVFLEVAHFAPSSISGRARRLGLHTDGSHRFERGVDPELPRKAVERATALLLEFAGGQAGPVDETCSTNHLPVRTPVGLRRERLHRILGVEVPDDQVGRILESLGMRVSTSAGGWSATPPSARFDIAIEEDLIEEIARIHGYDRIPVQAPRGEITPAAIPEDRIALRSFREQLAARGYSEAISYAFVAADLLKTWGLQESSIALANPLSAELAVMRTSLLPGLVAALDANRKRQQSRVRLFESGRSYHAGNDGPVEIELLSGVAVGDAGVEQWGEPGRAIDFFDLKGDVESLFRLAGSDASTLRFAAGAPDWLHPGRSATIWRGETRVGFAGALNPRLQKALDLDADVYVFELELATLAGRQVPVASQLSRFPSVRRDIAIVLADEIPYTDVEASIRGAVGERLVDLVLFDRYTGPHLGNGVKSLAMGLILQDRSRTLTDQDADQCVDLAVTALATGYNAKLRG